MNKQFDVALEAIRKLASSMAMPIDEIVRDLKCLKDEIDILIESLSQ